MSKKAKKKPTANAVPNLPQTRKVFISSPENLITHTRQDGLVETIDSATGEVIALSAHEHLAVDLSKSTQLDKILPRGFVEFEYNGKVVIMDQSIDPVALSHKNYSLSPVMKDLIFQDIVEGASLYSVSKKKQRPPYVLLCRFYMKDESFRQLVDTAKKLRAEYLYDRIMENADRLEAGHMNKAQVDGVTNATNFLKWGTEVSDPVNYGTKKADNVGITIVVSTGIDRSSSPTTIDVIPNKDNQGGQGNT